MKFIQKIFLMHQIKKDQKFLVKKGIEKAKEKGLELKMGGETLTLDNSKGDIYLPTNKGRTDVREIIALVADDYPERTKRYLANLDRVEHYL